MGLGFPKKGVPFKGDIGVMYGLGFPRVTGNILGVPKIRFVLFWGLYLGPPISGNYHSTPM